MHPEGEHLGAVIARDRGGSVGRAVVHDEHVHVRQLGPQVVEDVGQIGLLVPGRYEDERVRHRLRRSLDHSRRRNAEAEETVPRWSSRASRSRSRSAGSGTRPDAAKNSVGSAQVKPNSLNGTDIKESSLKGVVLGKAARGGPATRSLAPERLHAPAFTIPSTGRLRGGLRRGRQSSNHRFRNTTGSDATVWERHDGAPRRGLPRHYVPAPPAATSATRPRTRRTRSGSSARAARPGLADARCQVASDALGSGVLRPVRLAARHALVISVGDMPRGPRPTAAPAGPTRERSPGQGVDPGLLADRASSPGTRRLDRRVAQCSAARGGLLREATMPRAARWPSG